MSGINDLNQDESEADQLLDEIDIAIAALPDAELAQLQQHACGLASKWKSICDRASDERVRREDPQG